MPFKDPDPADPNMLVGVILSADAEATRDMAYVIAEEFARLGYTRELLLSLFKNPFYGGAHGAYRALGEAEILAIIEECVNAWGKARFSILDLGFWINREDEISNPNPDNAIPQSKIQKQPDRPKSKLASVSEQSKIQNQKSKMEKGWR